jgi:hypothetical protein
MPPFLQHLRFTQNIRKQKTTYLYLSTHIEREREREREKGGGHKKHETF